jgi:hypothetical protein
MLFLHSMSQASVRFFCYWVEDFHYITVGSWECPQLLVRYLITTRRLPVMSFWQELCGYLQLLFAPNSYYYCLFFVLCFFFLQWHPVKLDFFHTFDLSGFHSQISVKLFFVVIVVLLLLLNSSYRPTEIDVGYVTSITVSYLWHLK